jgi:DNA repair exonuclease SbcCD ATPase subunit
LGDDEDNPALAAAKQQMEAMNQEMQQMSAMLQNVQQSMEAQDQRRADYEAQIKAFEAETKRISAVQAGMTEQQIQDIAMGVVAAAMESNDMISQMPMEPQPEMMEQPPMMPPEGAMQ